MTAPMMPQAAPQPMQPPVPPPTPFTPRANDNEPKVATATMKRLSDLMFDPRYMKQPTEWRQVVDLKYQAAVQALQPPPVLPHGVTINAKGDASNLAQEEQAAIQGVRPQPTAQQPSIAQAKPPSPASAKPIPKMPGVGP